MDTLPLVPIPVPPKKKDEFNLEELRKQIDNMPKRAPSTGYRGEAIEKLAEKLFNIKIPPLFSPTPAPVPAPIP
ncbi:MAG: hypothetical protein JO154_20960 [Chitinophaga sp.]|uniref:hypothetical protein n=1 Tax=Chitinophaga sp. TaxID=1869181 RepID=UPI0025C16950|nr:hypothetical protein [Chitinophaga sp.]MBV8255085.1 hypothetical protein [Chitinophaga sp.]